MADAPRRMFNCRLCLQHICWYWLSLNGEISPKAVCDYTYFLVHFITWWRKKLIGIINLLHPVVIFSCLFLKYVYKLIGMCHISKMKQNWGPTLMHVWQKFWRKGFVIEGSSTKIMKLIWLYGITQAYY